MNCQVPVRRVTWQSTFRICRERPAIGLIEDIADPADREALFSIEARFNPRIQGGIGDLSRVPVRRDLSGPGASWLMAPFVHYSKNRPGRFSDGTFGLYYAGDRINVATAETVHGYTRLMRSTKEAPCTSRFLALRGSIDADLDDASGRGDLLDPEDYGPSQVFGAERRAAGSKGITWPSVRYPDGNCIGIFPPDVIPIPVEIKRFDYHWNGTTVDVIAVD